MPFTLLTAVVMRCIGWLQVRNAEKARKLLGPDVELVSYEFEMDLHQLRNRIKLKPSHAFVCVLNRKEGKCVEIRNTLFCTRGRREGGGDEYQIVPPHRTFNESYLYLRTF